LIDSYRRIYFYFTSISPVFKIFKISPGATPPESYRDAIVYTTITTTTGTVSPPRKARSSTCCLPRSHWLSTIAADDVDGWWAISMTSSKLHSYVSGVGHDPGPEPLLPNLASTPATVTATSTTPPR